MADTKDYPKNRQEWDIAIQKGLGITLERGKELRMNGSFPVQGLVEYIKKEYSEGFGENFVPALLRNVQGLINWVYGDGTEPYWPGSDTL